VVVMVVMVVVAAGGAAAECTCDMGAEGSLLRSWLWKARCPFGRAPYVLTVTGRPTRSAPNCLRTPNAEALAHCAPAERDQLPPQNRAKTGRARVYWILLLLAGSRYQRCAHERVTSESHATRRTQGRRTCSGIVGDRRRGRGPVSFRGWAGAAGGQRAGGWR
jgi:hypothetical protein